MPKFSKKKFCAKSAKEKSSNINKTLANATSGWGFTWNNYPECHESIIRTTLAGLSFETVWVYQKEKCPTTGTPHLQGTIFFTDGKKHRWSELKLPEQICFKLNTHRGGAFKYCTKLPSSVDGVYYTNKPEWIPKRYMEPSEYRPWQVELIAYLRQPPEKRKIVWVYSFGYERGKTEFSKHLCLDWGGELIGERSGDMARTIAGYVERHGKWPNLFVMNVPKDQNTIDYRGLENVKDGQIYSWKNDSKGMINPLQSHVVVFANFVPNGNKMDPKRYIMVNIDCACTLAKKQYDEDQLMRKPISLYELTQMKKPWETCIGRDCML